MTENDVGKIANGAGGNTKRRFEWCVMQNGERAFRSSQGHSIDAGVTSDYLAQIRKPGVLAHGASMDSAFAICRGGVERKERLHVHLGRLANSRPVGIRHGSEAVIVIDGDLCANDGIIIYQAENQVLLTEGIDGRIPPRYIVQAYELSTGHTLYNQAHGWIGEVPESEASDPAATLSWEEDESPITRTCVESTPMRGKREGEEGKKTWANQDPFDGNVKVEIDMESNASGSGARMLRTRSSMATNSSAGHSESIPFEGSTGSIEDGDDTDIHSPDWWERKFAREGTGGGVETAVEADVLTREVKEEVKSESRSDKESEEKERAKRRERTRRRGAWS